MLVAGTGRVWMWHGAAWHGAAQPRFVRYDTLSPRRGQTMTEYALMLSAIALAVAVAYGNYGDVLNSLVDRILSSLGG